MMQPGHLAGARRNLDGIDSSRPIWFGVAGGLVLAITLLMAYLPIQGPPCLFKATVHLPCPTCGMTRSLMALWHLNPALSFRYHPLGIPLAMLCTLLVWLPLRRAQAARDAATRFDAWLFRPRSIAIAVAVLLVVWVTRLCFVVSGSRFFLW